MKINRRHVLLFVSVIGGLSFSTAIARQAPPPPTLTRLEALKLDSVAGEVPVHFSKAVNRDIAVNFATSIAECRSLHAEAGGRPPIVGAILDGADWNRVTPIPYGMPHHSSVDTPYIVIVPRTWQDAPIMLIGARDRVAKAVGPGDVDRYVRLIALHEIGHIIFYGVIGQKNPDALYSRVPFWYVEFVANYFAAGCLRSRPDEAKLFRAGQTALLAAPPQKYTTLDDWDRLMMDGAQKGQPFLMTDAGGLNFARYQGLTGEMANRLHETGLGSKMIAILQKQWARPGRLVTADLVNDFESAAPGWRNWVVQQGALP